MKKMPSPSLAADVDPSVWRSCAGFSVRIPSVGSLVYYFPQGHSEQSSSPVSFSPVVFSRPFVLCRVLSVRHLSNPSTDEVFALLRLLPVSDSRSLPPPSAVAVDSEPACGVVSFAKVLTPSDANNGGGFSVPRFCADSIFPPLDYDADPPVQNLSITDVQGSTWVFRHIYRGTPRRHLLTTGWSKFVNTKKLIAGDSVVFMRDDRKKENQLFVGIRRAVKSNADSNGRWNCPVLVGSSPIHHDDNYDDSCNSDDGGAERLEGVFARTGRGRVSAEEVSRAAELAVHGMEFEVVYYPFSGSSEFIVNANVVESSLAVYWAPGMKVKMPLDSDDSSKVTWLQGTISSTSNPDNRLWRGSPWRMLQVNWEDNEVMQSVKGFNPWQVEYDVTSSPLHPPFPPAKKFRVTPTPGLLSDGEGELIFPISGLNNSMVGHLHPSLMNYTFPAGMQGARQNYFRASRLLELMNENSHQPCTDYSLSDKVMPKTETVRLDLIISSPLSNDVSPDSSSSGLGQVDGNGRNSPTKVGVTSFQLFGKVIHMEEPAKEASADG